MSRSERLLRFCASTISSSDGLPRLYASRMSRSGEELHLLIQTGSHKKSRPQPGHPAVLPSLLSHPHLALVPLLFLLTPSLFLLRLSLPLPVAVRVLLPPRRSPQGDRRCLYVPPALTLALPTPSLAVGSQRKRRRRGLACGTCFPQARRDATRAPRETRAYSCFFQPIKVQPDRKNKWIPQFKVIDAKTRTIEQPSQALFVTVLKGASALQGQRQQTCKHRVADKKTQVDLVMPIELPHTKVNGRI